MIADRAGPRHLQTMGTDRLGPRVSVSYLVLLIGHSEHGHDDRASWHAVADEITLDHRNEDSDIGAVGFVPRLITRLMSRESAEQSWHSSRTDRSPTDGLTKRLRNLIARLRSDLRP